MAKSADVDWDRVDKQKMFYTGVGLFSGVMGCLFPLTVLKTRIMVQEDASPGFQGVLKSARRIWAEEGAAGFYRGFPTVVVGTIPARVIYLGTLERVKQEIGLQLEGVDISGPTKASAKNFLGGACASLCSQSIVVPIDVVSQRQMVQGGAHPRYNGTVDAFVKIVGAEGIGGLYRGFGTSLITFMPSSAIWWGAYGFYGNLFFEGAACITSSHLSADTNGVAYTGTAGSVVPGPVLQVAAGMCAGCTSAFLTNPLDVIKTRLQVAAHKPGDVPQTFSSIAKDLIAAEGVKGLYRGVLPRMMNVSIWGTCMVSAYEFLKRICVMPDDDPV